MKGSETVQSQALNQVRRITQICDFFESPSILKAKDTDAPVTMPSDFGTLGFDISIWVGLGIVGLWSALDAYSERLGLHSEQCTTCLRFCLVNRFQAKLATNRTLHTVIEELEDLRHLHAHNFSGLADRTYFKKERHLLNEGEPLTLSCGGKFNGSQVSFQIFHLRYYGKRIREILEACEEEN